MFRCLGKLAVFLTEVRFAVNYSSRWKYVGNLMVVIGKHFTGTKHS